VYTLPAVQVSAHHRAAGGVLRERGVRRRTRPPPVHYLYPLANPAVTIRRTFSDVFAGMAPPPEP